MKVSVSILGESDTAKAVRLVNDTLCDYIHVDVMDGKFVTNKRYDISEIKFINSIANKKMDIHLMVNNPLKYIRKLSNMNIEYITFHYEINKNINRVINAIKKRGYKVGMAINPSTKASDITKYIDKIDMILVMSVEPGKGGQKFINNTIDKIKEIRNLNFNKVISVDGGINNVVAEALDHADILVVGSYITSCNSYVDKVNIIKNIGS